MKIKGVYLEQVPIGMLVVYEKETKRKHMETLGTMNEAIDFAKQSLIFLIPFTTAFILFFTLMELKAQKALIRRQQTYSELPLLRLQWSDKDVKESVSSLRKDNPEKFHSYTDLKLINVGSGMARDVRISPFKIGKKGYRLMNVDVLGSGKSAQLRYRNGFKHKSLLEDENYKQKFIVPVKYKDVKGSKWIVKFELNVDYNDGFRIVGPSRVDVTV